MTVTTEYHDSIVGLAQRQIHALEAELQRANQRAVSLARHGDSLATQLRAAQAVIANAQSWNTVPAKTSSPEYVRSDDLSYILSRADTSALAEHDHEVEVKFAWWLADQLEQFHSSYEAGELIRSIIREHHAASIDQKEKQ